MIQNARVVKIIDTENAEVAIERASACGGNCASCGGCATNRLMKVAAKNIIMAAAGDKVIIKTKSSKIIFAAFVVYIIPFLLFFIAYIATAAAKFTENTSVLISIAAFMVGAGIAYVYNRIIKKKRSVEFEIIAFSK